MFSEGDRVTNLVGDYPDSDTESEEGKYNGEIKENKIF